MGTPSGTKSPHGDGDGKQVSPMGIYGLRGQGQGRGVFYLTGTGMGEHPPTGNFPLTSLLAMSSLILLHLHSAEKDTVEARQDVSTDPSNLLGPVTVGSAQNGWCNTTDWCINTNYINLNHSSSTVLLLFPQVGCC